MTFVAIIFFLPIMSLTVTRTTDNEDFELIVIGCLSSIRYFGPPPIPPNYTTESSITWDLAGSYGMILRLSYYGSSSVKIVEFLFWQEATEFGITWNVTEPTLISPPDEKLITNAYFEFTVEGLFIAETTIYSKITLENQQEILISIPTPWGVPYVSSWTSSSTVILGNSIEYLLFFMASSSMLLIHRRRKFKNS